MTIEHVLARDIAAFDHMKAELQQYFNGKFVVFHDGNLQGSFDNFDRAARDAVKRFRHSPFLIRQVVSIDAMSIPTSAAARSVNGYPRQDDLVS